MKTQNDRIITHLKRRNLTRAEALNELAIGNLPARIQELRQAGHNIKGRWKVAKNKFGEDCKYMVYVLTVSKT